MAKCNKRLQSTGLAPSKSLTKQVIHQHVTDDKLDAIMDTCISQFGNAGGDDNYRGKFDQPAFRAQTRAFIRDILES